jgi:glycosyltransferase involved in cell wall biosynthesis
MITDKKEIIVSVCCAAYNQKAYIHDTIVGFLNQKTSFPIEIIIHDDASTDGTEEIIHEYHARYPNIIKPIYQSVNQYSKGISLFPKIIYPKVNGRYIAICEGDDYWTDPYKLQKQVDYMESHPDYSLVFHAVEIDSLSGKQKDKIKRNSNKSRDFSVDEIILGGGEFIYTPSILFKADLINNLPDWVISAPVGDYPLAILAAIKGRIHYLDEVMAVYRMGRPGSVTTIQRDTYDLEDWLVYFNKTKTMLMAFDQFTSGVYHRSVETRISQYYYQMFLGDKYAEKKNKWEVFRIIGDNLIFEHRFELFIRCLPFGSRVLNKAKRIGK